MFTRMPEMRVTSRIPFALIPRVGVCVQFMVSFNIFWILALQRKPFGWKIEVLIVGIIWTVAAILLALCLAYQRIGPAGNWSARGE